MEEKLNQALPGANLTSRRIGELSFVSSDMAYPVQFADVCIYALSWGFRLPSAGMDAPVRKEIADEFSGWLGRMQHKSRLALNDGSGQRQLDLFSIMYVPDPYTRRKQDIIGKKKEVTLLKSSEPLLSRTSKVTIAHDLSESSIADYLNWTVEVASTGANVLRRGEAFRKVKVRRLTA